MVADQALPVVTDCPAWCGVNHRTGAAFHAHCAGEVRWTECSVVLVVTQRGDVEGVEVAYHAAGKPPSIAFLGASDTRRLRDSLDDALRALDAA
ncbi:hypothetical protein ABT297_36920 [Dactylosporangium sp. NPDC000555]|uniref:hypothetical protein n=1 Tax=Dactylosporangium sp. NPDC000555 TaxID=3154260 RepID=UPI00332674E0